jgi:lipopolysaccharide export system permease protein
MPYANLKAGTLLYDIRKQKPALNIKAGMFYNGLEGFSIKINKKNENGIDLEDIMIYDHNSKEGNNKVILAKKGAMYLSENEQYFIISLEDGHSYYESNVATRKKDKKNRTHQRIKFEKDILRFDLSGFGMKRSSEDLYRNHYAMMNNKQLSASIDSLFLKQYNKSEEAYKNTVKKIHPDTSLKKTAVSKLKDLNILEEKRVFTTAMNTVMSNKALVENANRDVNYNETLVAKHLVEWHRKWSLAIACIIMFLIGAPLGAIIRKGGFGMPVVTSVFFFILYHVLSMTGEKMVKEGEITAYEGMWIANIILLPIGVWLIYKASKDSNLMDWSYFLEKIKTSFKKQSIS